MSDTGNTRRGRLQFGVRTLFFLLFVCAILLGWWRDRSRLANELELLTLAEVVTPLDLELCVFEESGQEVLVAT